MIIYVLLQGRHDEEDKVNVTREEMINMKYEGIHSFIRLDG